MPGRPGHGGPVGLLNLLRPALISTVLYGFHMIWYTSAAYIYSDLSLQCLKFKHATDFFLYLSLYFSDNFGKMNL